MHTGSVPLLGALVLYVPTKGHPVLLTKYLHPKTHDGPYKGDVTGPDVADLVILTLAAPTYIEAGAGKIDSIARLERLLYLGETKYDLCAYSAEPLVFENLGYGPYCADLHQAIDFLITVGFIEATYVGGGPGIDALIYSDAVGESADYGTRSLSLTIEGAHLATLLVKAYPNATKLLTRLKDSYADFSINMLVHYVNS
jgi:hypothetical protein